MPKAKAAKEAADLEKAELTKLKDWYANSLYIYPMYQAFSTYILCMIG